MTWPPPPPSSDPWAAEPEPQPAVVPNPFAEPPPEPEPEPEARAVPPPPAPAPPEDDAPPGVQPVLDEPAPYVEAPAPMTPAPVTPAAAVAAANPDAHDQAPSIDRDWSTGPAEPAEAPHEPEPPAASTPFAAPPPEPPISSPDRDAWPASYEPPRVVPRPQGAPPPSKKPVWLAAAAVAGLVVVGVVIWLLMSSGGDEPQAPAAPATTSAPRTADPQMQARLMSVLPSGYRPGACRAQTPPAGARAAASCGPNPDAGGPVSGTYTVGENPGAVDAAFNAVVNGSARVNCPGNIQSPGPWRRNATPDKVSGVLFCGIQQNRPVVAWTDADESLVAVVTSGPQGPDLDQLYAWWTTHS